MPKNYNMEDYRQNLNVVQHEQLKQWSRVIQLLA